MKYMALNKKSDFQRGRQYNLLTGPDGISVSDETPGRPGVFLSEVMDSFLPECRWHRLVMKLSEGENMASVVSLYGVETWEQAEQVEKQLCACETEMQWLEVMEPNKMVHARSQDDILLTGVTSRYLWISAVLWGNGVDSPRIGDILIYFSSKSWTYYLPEIYQGANGEFLERFLWIFQSLYEELEQKIRKSPALLDVQAADYDVLMWLSGWLDLQNSHLWPSDRLRLVLSSAAEAYAIRGTRRGLEQMITWFTGEKPFIVECLDELRPYEFTVYVREQAAPTDREYKALLKVISQEKPAHMEVRLIVLKPYLFLDRDSYLGINSVLKSYEPAVLDGVSMVSLSVLGGGRH